MFPLFLNIFLEKMRQLDELVRLLYEVRELVLGYEGYQVFEHQIGVIFGHEVEQIDLEDGVRGWGQSLIELGVVALKRDVVDFV